MAIKAHGIELAISLFSFIFPAMDDDDDLFDEDDELDEVAGHC